MPFRFLSRSSTPAGRSCLETNVTVSDAPVHAHDCMVDDIDIVKRNYWALNWGEILELNKLIEMSIYSKLSQIDHSLVVDLF